MRISCHKPSKITADTDTLSSIQRESLSCERENSRMNKNVAVIGLGSIGRLIAANIMEKGIYCCFLDSRSSRQHNEKFIYQKGKTVLNCSVPCGTGFKDADLYIVTLKTYLNGEVLTALRDQITPRIPVLVLQNGMGNCETVQEILPDNQIIPATTTAGAYRLENTVVHAGDGGIFYGGSIDLGWLSTDQLPWFKTAGIERMMLMKLAANSVINPLTALLKKTNGVLNSHKEQVKELTEEIYNVIGRIDCSITLDELNRYIWDIISRTAQNRSSMLSDLINGNKTEIDSIAGYVITQAEKHGIPLPKLRDVYNQIKEQESKND